MNAQFNRRDFIKRASLVPPCTAAGMGLGNVPAFGAEAIKRCGGPMLKVGLNAYFFARLLNNNLRGRGKGPCSTSSISAPGTISKRSTRPDTISQDKGRSERARKASV
jgi:hypothetical protein